jgi:predicted S18 family serine protease
LEIEAYPINTITRLQTFMIVKDRLESAENWLNKTQTALAENDKKEVSGSLAYAVERLGSAYSWAKFFDMEGEEYLMDNAVLMESCLSKISEAEERYNYVQLFFPHLLGAAKEYIDAAKSEYVNGDYKTCLYKAVIVKASINTISSAIGVEPEKIDILIDNKLEAAKKEIIKQQKAFPILGYSYYEYSNSLRKIDPYSALLYAEYALELSNLDIYFEAKEKRKLLIIDLGTKDFGVFLFGFIFGILILFLLYILFIRKPRRKTIRIKRKTKIRL